MQRNNKEKIFIYSAFFAIFTLGISLRLSLITSSKFPINDGGLFYQMTLELIENSFRLPSFTAYNHLNIPYAYPPLGFYVAGLLNNAFNIDLLQIFIWLPFIFNLCAIPIIFLLANNLLKNNYAALMATAFWTFASPSFEWLLMGGGVTRSLAYTASFASLYLFSEFQKGTSQKLLLYSIILGGITGLSHLEIFFVNTLSVLCLWYFNHQVSEKRSFKTIVAYFLGCILVMSPYLITVALKHEIQPLLAGFMTGGYSFFSSFFSLVIFSFAGERYLAITSFLCVIGITYQIIRKRYFFVVWFFLILFLDVRSVHRSLIFPVALLASVTIIEIIAPILNRPFFQVRQFLGDQKAPTAKVAPKQTTIYGIVFIPIIFIHILFLSYLQLFESKIIIRALTNSELNAFRWVEQNTSINSRFLILKPSNGWELDNVSEWFPAITKRQSLTTVQGTEWLPDNYFEQAKTRYNQVKNCIAMNRNCIDQVVDSYSATADYLWISISNCSNESSWCGIDFYKDIEKISAFRNVFQNDEVVILAKN